MKTPSDQLFRLIHAMSPAEKRYFKQSKDIGDDSNQTLVLFDLINTADEYDEATIKARMQPQDPSFVKNLKIHKHRLQQLILKSLRAFHEEHGIQQQIRALIADIEWLLEHQLFDLAQQSILKAKTQCLQYEYYEWLLVVLGIEARWMSFLKEHGTPQETAMVEMEQCATTILNYIQYAQINQQVLSYLNQQGIAFYIPPEWKDWVTDVITQQIKDKGLTPQSFVARRMHNHIFAIWHGTQAEYAQMCAYTLASVTEFEQNEVLLANKNIAYLSCLVNHCMALLHSQNHHEASKWIEKAAHYMTVYALPEPIKIYIYYCKLRVYILNKNFEGAYLYWTTTIDEYLHQTAGLTENAGYLLRLAMFEPLLVLGKQEEAGRLLRILTDQKQIAVATYIYAGYVLELIYHTEQMDTTYLFSLIAMHLKRLQRRQTDIPFFRFILLFFKKLTGVASAQARSKLIAQHIEAYAAFPPSQIKQMLEGSFDYTSWLAVQQSGKRIHEWYLYNKL